MGVSVDIYLPQFFLKCFYEKENITNFYCNQTITFKSDSPKSIKQDYKSHDVYQIS